MKVLLTYLKQRFNPAVFGGLTLLITLFSVPYPFKDTRVFLFILPVFLLLGILRLYDDIMNYHADAGKPNRIYTQQESRKLLALFLAAFTLLYLLVLGFLWPVVAGMAALFLVLNDLLYRLLYHKAQWKHYLPLLKYPVLTALLYFFSTPYFYEIQIGGLMIAIFCSFIVFELLDDPAFPMPVKWMVIFTNLAFTALIIAFLKPGLWWLYLITLLTANLLIRLKHKSLPYLFLTSLLVAKLTLEWVIAR